MRVCGDLCLRCLVSGHEDWVGSVSELEGRLDFACRERSMWQSPVSENNSCQDLPRD